MACRKLSLVGSLLNQTTAMYHVQYSGDNSWDFLDNKNVLRTLAIMASNHLYLCMEFHEPGKRVNADRSLAITKLWASSSPLLK